MEILSIEIFEVVISKRKSLNQREMRCLVLCHIKCYAWIFFTFYMEECFDWFFSILEEFTKCISSNEVVKKEQIGVFLCSYIKIKKII